MQNPEKWAAGSPRLFIKSTPRHWAGALAWGADTANEQSLTPATIGSAKDRPLMPSASRLATSSPSVAITWSLIDRPARMVVDYSVHENSAALGVLSDPRFRRERLRYTHRSRWIASRSGDSLPCLV